MCFQGLCQQNLIYIIKLLLKESLFFLLNVSRTCMKVAKFLKEPESDTEPYVPFHEIEDSDPSKEPRFTIIFASKKNLDKLKADRVLQTDATYRLNWMGYPVFVIGKRIFSI